MSEITELLSTSAAGAKGSLDEVFNRLHGELKILARSRIGAAPDQTLTATSLVHEVYLKLIGAQHLDLVSKQHFFACAASAMRQILVDSARAASARKRGGDLQFVTLTGANLDEDGVDTNADMLALDQVLQELERVEPGLMELVQLRFFAGLSMDDIAQLTDRSERSLHRDWSCAKAFLGARLAD
ncbi:MAG TPA: ECF-type sigma factor [Dokdonella sp.]|uniref:ECF-type sigma factor n=1 Tax=Dokdonella sp. TaxID=2291710 RepID=UPI002D7FD6AD|nr:ECF-type sigma factor [Dokdonella sp.]HET9031875.1 ECF-type sigma factor [Dokdonella sp.]